MVIIQFLVILSLVGCKPDAPPRGLLSTTINPCAASADASPDTPALDLGAPWTRTVITAGAATGLYRGADGTALDTEGCVSTAWEEGGIVTRACPGAPWGTELVAAGLPGVEDARAADLDGDGTLDVVSCSDSGGRCYVTFRGAPNVTTTLTASMGHGHAMQAAIADVNGDGRPDVLFGTRVGAPAVIAWLENPGATARTGSTWLYHQISLAGWTMSLVARDVDGDGDIDVIVSDRAKTSTGSWALYGARWEEQTATGWINHPISAPAGSCPVADPLCTTRTPGDEMFLAVDGDTVWDCQSSAASPASRVMRHRTADWLTWTHEVLPPAANVGHCQGVIPIQGGVAVTTWKGNSYPIAAPESAESGVYWLRDDGAWTRGEVSGPEGGKFDSAVWDGTGLITSEQLDPAGGLGVVIYTPAVLP